MVVGPACRTNQITAFALLVYLPHACYFDCFLVANPNEYGGALEEKGL
jgi:hypothetical protein